MIEPDDDDVTVEGNPDELVGRVPRVPGQDQTGGLHLLSLPGSHPVPIATLNPEAQARTRRRASAQLRGSTGR